MLYETIKKRYLETSLYIVMNTIFILPVQALFKNYTPPTLHFLGAKISFSRYVYNS